MKIVLKLLKFTHLEIQKYHILYISNLSNIMSASLVRDYIDSFK